MSEIGRSRPVLEARSKVDGTADYVINHFRHRMLHAAIVRSTQPHAVLAGIDSESARAIQGVHSVLTGQDVAQVIKDPYYGPAFHDQPILALDKVRYVGEPVAVVLAEERHVALAAAALVDVSYRDLPAVFDAVAACVEDAPQVHESLRPGAAFADLRHLAGVSGTNVALHTRLRHGDQDAAWVGDGQVFEHEYQTQQVAHAPLESHCAIAEFVRPDRLEVESGTQSPSFVRLELARLLGWRENQVRVMVPYLGGGFGAKLYMKLEALAVAAALIACRPVRVAITMDEQFFTISRHASTRESRRSRAILPPGHTASRPCRSTRAPSTPTAPPPARCAGSASRRWCSPTKAMPTRSPQRWGSTRSSCGGAICWPTVTCTPPAPGLNPQPPRRSWSCLVRKCAGPSRSTAGRGRCGAAAVSQSA